MLRLAWESVWILTLLSCPLAEKDRHAVRNGLAEVVCGPVSAGWKLGATEGYSAPCVK